MYALWNSTTGYYSFSTTNNGGVLITTAQYQALLTGESQGNKITQGTDGKPALQAISVTLEEAKSLQVATLSNACQAYLYAGFNSSALGSEYFYPSTARDQQNLASLAATGASASLWCELSGNWSLTSHTAAQIAQVNVDWVAYLNAAQEKLVTLSAEVNATTTTDAAEAITW